MGETLEAFRSFGALGVLLEGNCVGRDALRAWKGAVLEEILRPPVADSE